MHLSLSIITAVAAAHQVQAEALALLLEEVLGQLGREGGVQLLRVLRGQPAHVRLQRLVVVQLVPAELE